jgi:hypothetical protein
MRESPKKSGVSVSLQGGSNTTVLVLNCVGSQLCWQPSHSHAWWCIRMLGNS